MSRFPSSLGGTGVQEGRVDRSSACHLSLSFASGWAVMMILASSLRAAAQRVAALEMRERSSCLNAAVSDGGVRGWRIVRIRCTVDSVRFGSVADWRLRALIPLRVRTRQTLSLRPPEAESDVDTASKNWLTPW